MRRAVFFSTLAALMAYTGLQAARLFPGDPVLAWRATLAFFAAVVGWQLLHRAGRLASSAAWAAATASGVWAGFVLFSLPADAARLAFGLSPRTAAWAALSAAAAVAALGLREALAGPRVRRAVVRVEGLPEALRGLRIVQLSDLHVGPTIGGRYVAEVVRLARALEPDLVAVTGDLGDGAPAALADALSPLRELSAPLGAWFVPGNHEYYWGLSGWLDAARAAGLTPLLNEGRVVERGGARILVGGVADDAALAFDPGRAPDAAKAAAGGEGCALKVLLAHRPGASAAAEAAGFHLQLSGHTHGGQFFPFSLLMPLVHRHWRGLHRHGRLWLYVNTGTGYWGPPHRFAVPAEITALTLEPA